MIDLHFHCLPGIDDGPATLNEAVALCRAAWDDGVDSIVATPHVLRDPWLNTDAAQRQQLVDSLNQQLGGKPRVLPGCEFYFSADAIELWEMGERGPLTGLNASNYLLLEFPATSVPQQAEAVIHEFSIAGVHPVIAHPERNVALQKDIAKVRRLVELGARTQITAASLLGQLGARIQRVCDQMFAEGLVHFVASDAHSLDKRPPMLKKARAHVEETQGAAIARTIFETNPAAILAPVNGARAN